MNRSKKIPLAGEQGRKRPESTSPDFKDSAVVERLGGPWLVAIEQALMGTTSKPVTGTYRVATKAH